MTGEQIENIFKLMSKVDYLPRMNIILFESRPDFSDNTYWLFKYLAENTDIQKKYKLIWVVQDESKFRTELCGVKIECIAKHQHSLKEKLRYLWYRYYSKFIFDCNAYVYKANSRQTRVYLGHGMPVKIADQYLREQGDTDLNTFTSYCFKDMYLGYGFKESEMSNCGYCRNDILAKNFGKRSTAGEKRIIWMPTYRQHSNIADMKIENRFPLGLPVVKSHEDMAELNRVLIENNTILYLRPHPAQDLSVMKLDEMSNIVIADNDYLDKQGKQLYEFLTETDALITDYSSVYYDYLLLGRPIALMVEDLEDFRKKWKLYFDEDYRGNMKCRYIDNMTDFKDFIKETAEDRDEFYEERIKARDTFCDYHDGKTCERLYEYMRDNYNF